jgi:signal transduction histidine kinase
MAPEHYSSPVPTPENVLHRISCLATRASGAPEALQSFCSELHGHFKASTVAVALIDPSDGCLTIEASFGLPETSRHRLQPRQGLMGWSAFHGRAALLADVSGDWRYLPLHPDVRCEMTCPFSVDGQPVGVVSLGHTEVRTWDNSHLEILQTFCEEISLTLRTLWNTAKLERKASQLAVLIDISQKIVTKLDQQELLDSLTREALRLIGCPFATICLVTQQRDTLVPTSTASIGGLPSSLSTEALPVAETLIGSVLQTRKQMEVLNVLSPEYLDCVDIPRDLPVRSMLATPMISEGEVIGVISVFTGSPHRFADDEKRLMLALAGIGGVAIQNSRLYSRVFQSEEQLQRSEKLTTLGLLAAEIAHEIRNPLTVLKLLFGSLGLDFDEGDPRRQDVAIIGEKLDQLEGIVTRVLSFGRAPTAVHSRLDVDSVIRDTLLLVRLKLKQSRITYTYTPPKEPLHIDANRGQIQQVFLNVIMNAAQAMPNGGSLDVRCSLQQPAADSHGVPQAVVEIADTGHGIPEGLGMRIFDSFLTGRPDGTGLGLAITKRILVSHRGDIEVARTGPEGTVMRIRIPAT